MNSVRMWKSCYDVAEFDEVPFLKCFKCNDFKTRNQTKKSYGNEFILWRNDFDKNEMYLVLTNTGQRPGENCKTIIG